ncbi:MAG: hypothetical protein VX642_14415 [Bdellovibrionota bacterium]|nr:hypothetical protein [Bdellovibrionota bacterium]
MGASKPFREFKTNVLIGKKKVFKLPKEKLGARHHTLVEPNTTSEEYGIVWRRP